MAKVSFDVADEKTKEVIQTLSQIEQDATIPKNVRDKIHSSILALQSGDKSIEVKINRSLQELDEISDDPNVPTYTRTQIWHVVSLLESI